MIAPPVESLMVTLTVNGEPRSFPESTTVETLLRTLGLDPTQPGIAVAVNLNVVRRAEWAQAVLADGDAVELVTATQGG